MLKEELLNRIKKYNIKSQITAFNLSNYYGDIIAKGSCLEEIPETIGLEKIYGVILFEDGSCLIRDSFMNIFWSYIPPITKEYVLAKEDSDFLQ